MGGTPRQTEGRQAVSRKRTKGGEKRKRRLTVSVYSVESVKGKHWYTDHDERNPDGSVTRVRKMRGSHAAATAKARELEKRIQLEEAGILQPTYGKEQADITLGDYWRGEFTEYLRSRRISAATLSRYNDTLSALQNCLLDAAPLTDIPLKAFGIEHVVRFKNHRIARGIAPAGLNKNLDHLQLAFKYAAQRRLITAIPLIEKDRLTKRLPRSWEWNEITELLKACRVVEEQEAPHGGAQVYGIIATLVYTGCRYGEVINLTPADVFFDLRKIYVGKTKTGLDRWVPLPKPAANILQAYIGRNRTQPDQRIFPHASCRKTFKQACKIAGLQYGQKARFGVVIHSLRHANAQILAATGADIRDVAQVHGHEDLRMAQHYERLNMKRKLEVVDGAFGEEGFEPSEDHVIGFPDRQVGA